MAALSSRHAQVDKVTVGSHRLVSLFLRGALRLRPPKAQRAPAWDLNLMLDTLRKHPFEPLAQVGLEWLSMKTAFLLTIVSAKRVEELHALSVSDSGLSWNSEGSSVTLWPNMAFLPRFWHHHTPISLSSWPDLNPHQKRAGQSCCAQCGLWRLMLKPPRVYGSVSNSSFATEVLRGAAACPNSGSLTGLWTPLCMPTRPVPALHQLGWRAGLVWLRWWVEEEMQNWFQGQQSPPRGS